MGPLAVMAAVAALSGLTASPASAQFETYMTNQGLSAGNAKASVSAHSGTVTTSASADHTFCPAMATGYSGYTSTPFAGGSVWTWLDADCGPGFQTWTYNAGGSYVHGAVYNPNISTYDTFSAANFIW